MEDHLSQEAAVSRLKEVRDKAKVGDQCLWALAQNHPAQSAAHDAKSRVEGAGGEILSGSDAGDTLSQSSAEDKAKSASEHASGAAHGAAASVKEKLAEGAAAVKNKIADAGDYVAEKFRVRALLVSISVLSRSSQADNP